jgi:hypothetical protein
MTETVAGAVKTILATLDHDTPVVDVFLEYVYQLKEALYESTDITSFIFGVRAFFAWHRADGFERDQNAHDIIREAWATENEKDYTRWLSSADDSTKDILWSKWTFQAKSTILEGWLREKLKSGSG